MIKYGVVMKVVRHLVILWLCFGTMGCRARADVICPRGDMNADCRVDVEDLVILGSRWLEGSMYPQAGLRAYWRLDEAAGTDAADETGNGHTGQLLNGCAWLPSGGVFGGAIQLDGVDDFVRTPFVLDPADGPLSAMAWVKGGQPWEVILAQTSGAGIGREWLQTNASGKLLTRLSDGLTLLSSDTAICDGDWHHVGVIWDGARRYLYVDGAQVASDTEPLVGLQSADGKMHIGAGQTLLAAHFWTGQIDDVRIYDRALSEAEMAAMVRPPAGGEADLDGRGGVGLADFAKFAHNWMLDFSGEYRCIWIDSWNTGFLSASQADNLIATCRENNINTVIVEIRKVGDAYYNSALEPRATNIVGSSFDPLAYLLQIAHDTSGGKKYVEVHAWFVAQRISTAWPLPSAHTQGAVKHVLHNHPEYVMLNSDGQPSASGSNTRFLDPGHPGAVDHNVAVVVDCLSKYAIDGINLDYIRYPEYAGNWGYNPVSIARFNAFHGKSGQPSASDPDWSNWRRECVTNQVKKIYVKSLMIAPHVVLTVDTVPWGWTWNNFESSRAYAEIFQDWVGWLRAGIVDYNTLMSYVRNDPARYEGWCKLSLANDDTRGSILATGAYMQDTVQDAVDQLLAARSWGAAGLNIYDWGSEVNGNKYGETRTDFYREIKAQVFPTWVDPPMHAWKVRPETGIIEGTVTAGGVPVDHAVVMLNGRPATTTYTDGSGWYAIMGIEPGDYAVRFSAPGRADVVIGASVGQGHIVTVDSVLVH
ncbi:MAG: family 10 glycosylhydrolase [Phycisphaerae bacterium]|nr:family 10 glycosylhydrolase [Phycisphaerae bacterium]